MATSWITCCYSGIIFVLIIPYVPVATGNSQVHTSSMSVPPESQERHIIRVLLDRYKELGTVARPVVNATDTVSVQFGIRLVHLDIYEKEQMMKTSVWIRMMWVDEYLKWEPEEFGGVTHITVPGSKIWTPDISLVNTGDTDKKEQSVDVSIKYTGRVFWAPQRMFKSACLIDVTEYPYDRHTCDMWFQSISNYDWSLDILPYYKSPLDLDTYLSSYRHAQEWDIISNTSQRFDRPRDVGMILMYSRRVAMRFSLTIQRRPGFKAMLLTVPCALLSFLFPLIFCFPPERPDRHTLAMSLFASLTIMLFMVNETAPPSAAFVPRLTLYYSFNLLVLLVATCCSALVVNTSRRGETRDRVPTCVRKVFIKFLGMILCFGKRLEHLTEVKKASRRVRQRKPSDDFAQIEKGNVMENQMPSTSNVPETFPLQQQTSQIDNDPGDTALAALNRKLTSIETRMIQNNKKKEEIPDILTPTEVRMEWRTLSLVLDRLFFYLFLIMDFISLGVFHPRYVD